MNRLVVEGGAPLRGEVRLAGAKNTVSKLMVASLLTGETCEFHNVPGIDDTRVTRLLCESLGARFTDVAPGVLQVRTPVLSQAEIPGDLAGQNRLSILMLGPMLHRLGRAVIPAAAGGDRIGPRPVDFHLEGFRRLGADVEIRDNTYFVRADGLRGADIVLPYPSVTTTT